MAVISPFKISWGSQDFGGNASSSGNQLAEPYVIDISFERIRLTFDVVVVGTSYATLQNTCATLESNCRLRDKNLVIDLDNIADPGGASTWTYTHGSNFLNGKCSIVKSGTPEFDRGYSRRYTVVIEGELPADDGSNTGIREIQWNVAKEPGGQRIVSVRGIYTSTTAESSAVANYEDAVTGADAEVTTFLAGLANPASTFEKVSDSYVTDRNDHLCEFNRQYVEMTVNQVEGTLDDTDVVDHRVVFTDQSSHPGDSGADIRRLRRVTGQYECAMQLDGTDVRDTDLQTLFDTKVRDHVKALFVANFSPAQFAFEAMNIGYDESRKRLAAQITFVYQPSGGSQVIEVSSSITFRHSQTPDFTYVHDGDPLSAYIDRGFATKERIGQRVAIVMGEASPGGFLDPPGGQNPAGNIPLSIPGMNEAQPPSGLGDGQAQRPGSPAGAGSARGGRWITIAQQSQARPQWIGDPDYGQIRVTVMNESVHQRWVQLPARGKA